MRFFRQSKIGYWYQVVNSWMSRLRNCGGSGNAKMISYLLQTQCWHCLVTCHIQQNRIWRMTLNAHYLSHQGGFDRWCLYALPRSRCSFRLRRSRWQQTSERAPQQAQWPQHCVDPPCLATGFLVQCSPLYTWWMSPRLKVVTLVIISITILL